MSPTCSCAGAPDANALIAIKSLGTTALLLLVVPLQPARKQQSKHADRIEDPTTSDHATPTTDEPQALVPFLNYKTTNIIRAGLELGVYSAVGSILQAWGLARVPATAAGFLVQFTSVITPAVAVLAGQTISRRTQLAIVVAFAGTLMTAFDNAMARGGADAASADSAAMAALGSGAILAAAACYSIATFRIGALSPGALRQAHLSSVRLRDVL